MWDSARKTKCRVPYAEAVFEEGEGEWRDGRIAKKIGRHVPLLVTVNEPRGNGADVRAGTDEKEDDEQEGLEVEERGLRGGFQCMSEV